MSEIDSNTISQKPHSGILSIVSLFLSILAIIAVILSIRRIESIQDSPVCLIAETPGYNVIHSLCTIFPTGSLIAGIVALKRMLRSRRRLWSIMFASGGVIISLAILVIYWLNLAQLASGGHVHVH
jgi:lipopolysaccharide export LptBFGC system permease protein LptF